MTRDELVRALETEVSHHPSQEMLEVISVLKNTPKRDFRQVWKSIQPDEVVYWPELVRRLQLHQIRV